MVKLDGVDFYSGNRHGIEIYDGHDKVGPLPVIISEEVRVNGYFQIQTRLETAKLYEFLQSQFDNKAYGNFVQCEAQVRVWPADEFKTCTYRIQIICIPTKATVGTTPVFSSTPPDVFIEFLCLEINYD